MSKHNIHQSFVLHPQLATDCFVLGQLEISQLLLMNNQLLPWFILVPKTEVTEFFQLDAEQQYLLLQEINALSAFVLMQPHISKINLGTLGNLVPQLHWHVIGRHPADYGWPGPVWGRPEREAYAPGAVRTLLSGLQEAMATASVAFRPNTGLQLD